MSKQVFLGSVNHSSKLTQTKVGVTRTSVLQPITQRHRWSLGVAAGIWSGGWPCGTWPCTCGIWFYLWVKDKVNSWTLAGMQELLVDVRKPSHIHVQTGSNHHFSESTARLEKQTEEVVLLKPRAKVLSQDHGRMMSWRKCSHFREH